MTTKRGWVASTEEYDGFDRAELSPDSRYADGVSTEELFQDAQRDGRRARRLVALSLLALIASALALAWWTRGPGDDGDDRSETAPAIRSDADSGGDDSAGQTVGAARDDEGGDEDEGGQDDSVEPETTTLAVLPAPPAGAPYVDATLTDNVFVLSGVVPSDEFKQALESRAELAYAPFASSQLEVDESVGQAEWLAAAPEVVGLLPMITDGTIRLQEGRVTLAGRSPNPQYAEFFEQTVSQITGLPVSADSIEITDLVPPRFVATVESGQVTLEGEIPSEALVQAFIQGAAAVYGPDNVTSTMTVDEGSYTSFWNYTMPGVFQLLAPFPSYRIQVEQGVTSGSMAGGVVFEVNSPDIAPEVAEILGIGVAVLARDRSLDMTVVGHTDSTGPRDFNERLSLARAESVVDFLVAAGIDSARLTAEGRGPDDPIATNDTPEGRALNRRVEFLFD